MLALQLPTCCLSAPEIVTSVVAPRVILGVMGLTSWLKPGSAEILALHRGTGSRRRICSFFSKPSRPPLDHVGDRRASSPEAARASRVSFAGVISMP